MGSGEERREKKKKKKEKKSWRHAEALITINLTPSKRSQRDKSNDTKKCHQW
jgi:hypothetical protein